MKKVLRFILTFAMMATVSACSKDNDPNDYVTWDIYPSEVIIELVDGEGNNLLDPEVSGNWVGEPMSIGYEDKTYDVIWNPEDLQPKTRSYMPHFYGAVWSGLNPYEKVPYFIFFGEFSGDINYDMKLTFGITAINTVYDFEFTRRFEWKNKEPHSDNYITYKGERIKGCTLQLIVPKNPNSDKGN